MNERSEQEWESARSLSFVVAGLLAEVADVGLATGGQAGRGK